MPQSILYYPTIDIQDGNWLRNAVLYWDSVSSIVPFEEYNHFSPELKYLRENGVYFPSFPKDLFESQYANDFTQAFLRRLKSYAKGNLPFDSSPKKCASHHLNTKTKIQKNKIHAPILYDLIHQHKIPRSLYEFLIDERYISDYGYDGWMEIDNRVATIYMRTLAEFTVKASEREMVIGSDRYSSQQELYFRSFPSSNQFCYSLKLTNCFPQPNMDIGYEYLLNFKQKRRQEFQHFKIQLYDFERTLSMCHSIEEVRFEENAFFERWQTEIEDMRKIYKDERIKCFWGSLSSLIATPVVPEMIERIGGNALSPFASSIILGGAGLISVGHQMVNYRNKINEHNRNSGFLYILEGQRVGVIEST